MKRMTIACLAAAALILATQQQASAWSNFNFGAGVNTGFSSGGMRVLWGAFSTQPSSGNCQDGQGQGQGQFFDPMMAPPGMQQPMPGTEKKTFFRNRNNQPQMGYGQWGQPTNGYYPPPQYGYYPQPGMMEMPVSTIK